MANFEAFLQTINLTSHPEFLKSVNYHPFQQLNGNAAKKVLEKLDDLESKVPDHLQIFVVALRAFDAVRKACFGQVLDPSYLMAIENFRIAYLALGIKITPKVHIVLEHVGEFCERHGQGLGFFSEQAR